jgi:hypothetical protein
MIGQRFFHPWPPPASRRYANRSTMSLVKLRSRCHEGDPGLVAIPQLRGGLAWRIRLSNNMGTATFWIAVPA